MTTKNATKSASKKTDAKAASATEKARKNAIAAIGKRIDAAPETTDNSVTATAPAKVTKLEKSPKPKKAAKEKKPAKSAKPAKEKAKRTSALDAAATVLAASKEPLRTKDIVEAMSAKGLWSSPNGKTPEATLHAALMREIKTKGNASRFKKGERGLFATSGKAA